MQVLVVLEEQSSMLSTCETSGLFKAHVAHSRIVGRTCISTQRGDSSTTERDGAVPLIPLPLPGDGCVLMLVHRKQGSPLSSSPFLACKADKLSRLHFWIMKRTMMSFQERRRRDTYILLCQQSISSSAPERAAAWVFSQLCF